MLHTLLDPNNPLMWVIVTSILAGAIVVIYRPFLSFVRFVYPNAKYEAMGNVFLHQPSLQRLIESGSLEGFVEQLNTQKDYKVQGTTASEVQQNLDQLFVQTIEHMKKDHAKTMHPFFDRYLEIYDTSTVKTVIKLKRRQQNIEEPLHKQVMSKRVQRFIQQLESADPESYLEVIKDFGFSVSFIDLLRQQDTSDESIDAAIDRQFIESLHQIKVPYKCQQAKHLYIKRLIDITSIKLLLRAKKRHIDETECLKLYIDEGYEILLWKFKELCKAETVSDIISLLEATSYGPVLRQVTDTTKTTTTSVQPYSDALDQYMLTIMKDISNNYYSSIGPTLRFLYAKQTEITNLKIIAKGLSEQLPTESITSLLRTEVEV